MSTSNSNSAFLNEIIPSPSSSPNLIQITTTTTPTNPLSTPTAGFIKGSSEILSDILFKSPSNTTVTATSAPHVPNQEPDFLDMLSADMDFEQAYTMYTHLQPEQAMSSVQELEKVQQLNQQYITSLQQQHLRQEAGRMKQLKQEQMQNSQKAQLHQQQSQQQSQLNHFPGNNNFSFNLNGHPGDASAYSYDRAQIFASSVNTSNSGNANSNNYSFVNEATGGSPTITPVSRSQQSFDNQQTAVYEQPEQVAQQQKVESNAVVRPSEDDDDFDKFFSNTESNALEQFLDNLANNTNSNPLQFYNNSNSNIAPVSNQMNGSGSPGAEFHDIFDLYTMKTFPNATQQMTTNNLNAHQFNSQKNNSMSSMPVQGEHETLKKELSEAFSISHFKSVSNAGNLLGGPAKNSVSPQNQLPTPIESRESSSFNNNALSPELDEDRSSKRDSDMSMDEDDEPMKKRRRSSTKPLLSLEQKRLNHSHSEQRRRQMCKLAYERCLRLIIDIDAFNRLPPETAEMQKKTKRARVNKDGLPNLSKHSALMRISNEICLIKNSNEELKKLLEAAGVTDHLSFEKLKITDSL